MANPELTREGVLSQLQRYLREDRKDSRDGQMIAKTRTSREVDEALKRSKRNQNSR